MGVQISKLTFRSMSSSGGGSRLKAIEQNSNKNSLHYQTPRPINRLSLAPTSEWTIGIGL